MSTCRHLCLAMLLLVAVGDVAWAQNRRGPVQTPVQTSGPPIWMYTVIGFVVPLVIMAFNKLVYGSVAGPPKKQPPKPGSSSPSFGSPPTTSSGGDGADDFFKNLEKRE